MQTELCSLTVFSWLKRGKLKENNLKGSRRKSAPFFALWKFCGSWGSVMLDLGVFLEGGSLEVSAEICLDAVIRYNCGRFRPIKLSN